jgi:hypothetical protein
VLDGGADLLLDRVMRAPSELSRRKQVERAARNERLAQALRDNLRRRKEQARMQADGTRTNADPSPTLSGEPLSSKINRYGGTTAD